MADEEPSTLPRRQLGRVLRDAREGSGFSMERAARLAELSKTALHRIETGSVKKIRIRDVQALCEIYEIESADAEQTVALARQAQASSCYTALPGHYGDATLSMYLGLIASSRELIAYHEIVIGLLQTAEYARALIGDFCSGDQDEIDRRVETRMKRQHILTRRTEPVKLEVLLHESALHRMVGGPRVMAGQLKHLAEISKLPNISVRIHPFGAGCARGVLHGPFTILDFGQGLRGRTSAPPLVYIEGNGRAAELYMEDPEAVECYRNFAAIVRSSALDEPRTRDLLRRVARSYTQ